MVKLLNSLYLGASTPDDYGKATGAIELLPFDLYLGAATPSGIRTLNVLLSGVSPLTLLNAIELNYIKAFGKCEHDSETYIDSVTLDGKCEQRNLPDNYIQRQYIYMQEGSYLLTDIVPTYDCKVEMDFQTTILPADSGYLLGGRTVTYGGLFFVKTSTGVFMVDAFGNTSGERYFSTVTVQNNTRYKFTFNNKVATVESGGTTLFTNTFTGALANGAALCINGLNSSGTIVGGQAGIYLYAFKVWNNQGQLIADYIPAVQRGTVPVAGFYDMVTGTFKEATEGTFTAGAEAVPTPSTPMDIVCNNGTIKVSPNLFDQATKTTGYYISATGVITEELNSAYSALIPVLPNTTYILSGYTSSNSSNKRLHAYDKDGNWISQINYVAVSGPSAYSVYGITPANCRYIRISIINSDTNVQVEQGSTATPYKPYGEIYYDGTVETATDNVGNVATAQPLLSVGNYKDTQEILSGAVTRNVGIKVLDGTEPWILISGFTNMYYTEGTDYPIKDNAVGDGVPACYCSHFNGELSTVNGANQAINTIKIGYSGNVTTYHKPYIKSDAFNSDADNLKQFLSDQYANGTPVIVIYPLATATTESVSGQVLNKEPVTVTGSLTGLVANTVSSTHTTPKPTQPLDIVANNGVIKVSPNLLNPAKYESVTTTQSRWYYSEGYTLKADTAYTFSCDGGVTVYIMRKSDSAALATRSDSVTYTPTEDVEVWFRIYKVGGLPETFNAQLELGSTATPYMPYGQIYTDGTVETVEVTGKNLFDINTAIRYRCSANGHPDEIIGVGAVSDSSNAQTYAMAVKPNTTYTISKVGGNRLAVAGFKTPTYPSDTAITTVPYTYNGIYEVKTGSATFTTDSDCVWIIFSVRNNNSTFDEATNVQVELGSTATTYVPYFNGGSATAEMLLKVGNFKDVQSIIDGAVTRNVGALALDGTEDWTESGTSGNDDHRFNLVNVINGSTTDCDKSICSHITKIVQGGASSQIDRPCIRFAISGQSVVWYSADNTESLATFKQFLTDQYNAGTPVIVVYPLATPTTETVTGQTLTIAQGTNVVTAEGSVDDLELEISYKAYAEVTVEEIEAVNTDENVEVTIS